MPARTIMQPIVTPAMARLPQICQPSLLAASSATQQRLLIVYSAIARVLGNARHASLATILALDYHSARNAHHFQDAWYAIRQTQVNAYNAPQAMYLILKIQVASHAEVHLWAISSNTHSWATDAANANTTQASKQSLAAIVTRALWIALGLLSLSVYKAANFAAEATSTQQSHSKSQKRSLRMLTLSTLLCALSVRALAPSALDQIRWHSAQSVRQLWSSTLATPEGKLANASIRSHLRVMQSSMFTSLILPILSM